MPRSGPLGYLVGIGPATGAPRKFSVLIMFAHTRITHSIVIQILNSFIVFANARKDGFDFEIFCRGTPRTYLTVLHTVSTYASRKIQPLKHGEISFIFHLSRSKHIILPPFFHLTWVGPPTRLLLRRCVLEANSFRDRLGPAQVPPSWPSCRVYHGESVSRVHKRSPRAHTLSMPRSRVNTTVCTMQRCLIRRAACAQRSRP
jgi:hypothetical protein